MTLVAEKSPMKSRTAYFVFKLRALEMLCEERGIDSLTYAGNDKSIDAVLSDWCTKTSRTYRRVPTAGTATGQTVIGARVSFLPHWLRALVWFAWTWWTRVRPIRARRNMPRRTAATAVVTYFPNCDIAKLRDGVFRSNYWQDLHGVLDMMPGGIEWIWLYVPSPEISLASALDFRDRCNQSGNGQHFRLLDEDLGFRGFGRAVLVWARMASRTAATRVAASRPMARSRLNLAPILREDWTASISGIVAAEAAYYLTAFQATIAACDDAPRHGLYVFEQQPWELALISAWKRRGVGTVIAHQHEAIKPLNLRLFDDRRTFGESGPDAKPRPDVLATGSEDARREFRESGWPEGSVRLVEALRFSAANPGASIGTGRQLLLITGYLGAETRRMLALAAEADRRGALGDFDGVTVKPHPFMPVEEMLAKLNFMRPVFVSKSSLNALWSDTRFAFVANSTAAVFDALVSRIPCAVCAPDDDLNFSPALGIPGVPFVASPEELIEAMRAKRIPGSAPTFCNDGALTRWKTLLNVELDEHAGAAEVGHRTGDLN
jgi:surface carbohydrate biosynthesis protein (TIGR04326 family)